MPRSSKNSRASGSSEAPLVLSGEEDGVAPPPKISPAEKERLRQMQQACTLSMYDHAVAYFKRTLQRTKTDPDGCYYSVFDGWSHLDMGRKIYRRDSNPGSIRGWPIIPMLHIYMVCLARLCKTHTYPVWGMTTLRQFRSPPAAPVPVLSHWSITAIENAQSGV